MVELCTYIHLSKFISTDISGQTTPLFTDSVSVSYRPLILSSPTVSGRFRPCYTRACSNFEKKRFSFAVALGYNHANRDNHDDHDNLDIVLATFPVQNVRFNSGKDEKMCIFAVFYHLYGYCTITSSWK